MTCTVEYETANEAENAFLEAGCYDGKYFDISYEQNLPIKEPTTNNLESSVQQELNAMNPTMQPFEASLAPASKCNDSVF